MEDIPDFYEILHVHPDAPVEIIRASYKAMMQGLKLHPDLGGDHDNAVLINSAYDTLRNEAKRAAYDEKRQVATRPVKPRKAAPKRAKKSGAKKPAPQPSPPKASEQEQAPRSGPNSTPKSDLQDLPQVGNQQSPHIVRCAFCGAPHRYGAPVPTEALCSVCQSPLRPPQRYNVESADRRAIERLPKQLIIRFFTQWPGDPHVGSTRNISLNGMLFETQTSLVPDQILKIDCDVCRVTARVAHVASEADLWIVGVEFITLRFEQTQGGFVSTKA